MKNEPLSIKGARPARVRTLTAAALLAALACAALLVPARAALAQDGLERPVKWSFDAHSSFYQAGITASDINGDGKKELLVGNLNGRLYCFSPGGRSMWSRDLGAAIQGAPACCDVDGDGKEEVWIGDMDGDVWGLDCYGRTLSRWDWPKHTPGVGGIKGVFSSPAVGDIDGDGRPEIVVGTYGQHVYAWRYTGELLPGWPFNNEDTIWSSPALADIDWDGVKEVVIGADSTGGVNFPYPPGGLLYALDGDATILRGFPKVTPEVTWSSPAVADLDGDGRYEIVVGTGHYYTSLGRLTGEGHRVYAYNSDGTALKGWPVNTAGCVFSSPAVGDIDGDGAREIVVGTNAVGGNGAEHVTAFERDGKVVFDVGGLGGPTMGSPALGDISGDGVADVILGSGQQMLAWDHSGGVLWKQDMGNFLVGDPAVGDLDGDGRVEVAVVTGDAPGGRFKGGRLYVFDCGPKQSLARGADPGLFPWPMFRRTPDHRATFLTGKEPPPPGPTAPSKKWYLAEGSTGVGMETWVLVQNPNSIRAHVRLTYVTPHGAYQGPELAMPPGSRTTVNVADTIPATWEVSTIISSDRDVVVERAMYGNNRTWAHDSVGVTAPSRTWYLAEGSTGPGMETWILVLNPGTSSTRVRLTYMTPSGPRQSAPVSIPARSRRTFNAAEVVPDKWEVSTQVSSDKPVVAERAVYGNRRSWATGSIGISVPSTAWYLAEGSTGPGMETWILVQNPTYPEAHVELTYMTPGGPVAGPRATIPSSSRKTFFAADTVNGVWGVSTVVRCDKPVVVERAMYGGDRTWAHDSIGVSVPGKDWYLAEGSTGPGMETWVLVENPNRGAAGVKLTYMTPRGAVAGPAVSVPGMSRATFFAGDTLDGVWSVSTRVTADRPVVVERAMYGNGRTWATDSIGFAP